MNLLTDKGYFLIAVLIYCVSVVYSVRLWRKGFRRNDWVIYGLYWLAFLFHTGAMLTRGYSLSR